MIKGTELKRKPEVIAGIFSLFTGFSIILSLLTDIEFLSYFSSLSEDIEYLSENKLWLQLNSFLWIISALLMLITSSAMISALVPHQSFLGYLHGFFLLFSSAMLCFAGLKGFSINMLLENLAVIDTAHPDVVNANVLMLTGEKEIYLKTAYNLIGLSFFVLGFFSYVTSKIPILVGMLSTITGIMIAVFTLFIPHSILADLGMIMACCMFFILTIRFLFRGLEKRQRRRKKNNPELTHP